MTLTLDTYLRVSNADAYTLGEPVASHSPRSAHGPYKIIQQRDKTSQTIPTKLSVTDVVCDKSDDTYYRTCV